MFCCCFFSSLLKPQRFAVRKAAAAAASLSCVCVCVRRDVFSPPPFLVFTAALFPNSCFTRASACSPELARNLPGDRMSHRQPRDHKQSSRAFTSVLHRFSQCLGKIFHRLRVDLFFLLSFFYNKRKLYF